MSWRVFQLPPFSLFTYILDDEVIVDCGEDMTPPRYLFEIYLLLDMSSSFSDELPEIKQTLKEVIPLIAQEYPGSKVGLGAFVDKPILSE